jgi:hypothetical protein
VSSRRIAFHETANHFITVAEWNSEVTGTSYEVGVREKHVEGRGAFDLVASYVRSEAEILETGKRVEQLSNEGRSIQEIREALGGETVVDRLFDRLIDAQHERKR